MYCNFRNGCDVLKTVMPNPGAHLIQRYNRLDEEEEEEWEEEEEEEVPTYSIDNRLDAY